MSKRRSPGDGWREENMEDADKDYCWCGTRVTYLATVGKWLCSAHGYQERVYGPTPDLPTLPHA